MSSHGFPVPNAPEKFRQSHKDFYTRDRRREADSYRPSHTPSRQPTTRPSPSDSARAFSSSTSAKSHYAELNATPMDQPETMSSVLPNKPHDPRRRSTVPSKSTDTAKVNDTIATPDLDNAHKPRELSNNHVPNDEAVNDDNVSEISGHTDNRKQI